MATDLLDDLLQLVPGFVGWRQAHQFVESSIQVALVGLQRGVGETGAAFSDGAGALEQTLQAGPEHLVALVDGVLDVADEMGEADLMLAFGPAHLAAVAVGSPIVGTPIAQERLHDFLGAMFVGDEDRAVGMMEYP